MGHIRPWYLGIGLLVGLAAGLGTLWQSAEAIGSIRAPIIDYYENSAWQVWSPDYSFYGSTWPIAPGYYITNKHVTGGDDYMWMVREEFPDTPTYKGKVYAESNTWDLALIYCEECKAEAQQYADLGPYPVPRRGTMTFGGGYGKGYLSVHSGWLQGSVGEDLMTATPSTYGDSGSPEIIWDNGPVLVGVRSGGINNWLGVLRKRLIDGEEEYRPVPEIAQSQAPHKGILIPASTVRNFLDEVGFELPPKKRPKRVVNEK